MMNILGSLFFHNYYSIYSNYSNNNRKNCTFAENLQNILIKRMDTTRQQKISRLVQKELSEIFRRETAKTRGTLVTVSSVRVSPDLSVANVRLSIFPSENAQAIIDNINASERSIRHQLAQQVRYQLRRCPELKFHIDDSLDYIDHIDELLAKDKKSESSENTENSEN